MISDDINSPSRDWQFDRRDNCLFVVWRLTSFGQSHDLQILFLNGDFLWHRKYLIRISARNVSRRWVTPIA